jgi:membrane-bound lytic murein transglycosylase MltF
MIKQPRGKLIGAVILLVGLAGATAVLAQQPAAKQPRQLKLETQAFKGDFDAMLERRVVRIMVPYSRSLYFVDKGQERGLTAEFARDFERYLNKKYAKELGKRPLTVYLVPTTRDKLLGNVVDGLGDIAAGNLTVTEGRLKTVDFVAAKDRKATRELVVTGPAAPAIAAVEDLSGKTVHLRPTSSYHDSALALNERLRKAGKAPTKIVPLPEALEDEDVMEMLNAGLFEFAVVDDWKAKMWAAILPKIKVREDLVLRAEGHPGWAIRKGSPQLNAVVTDFYVNFLKKQGVIESRLAQTHKRVKQIKNNASSEELKRFEQTIKFFEQYGAKYGFDPLMLAAQGFQESGLRQDAKSHVGAIGVMQIMPATGKGLGVGDIREIEPNIHGGAKYMDQLMTKYFPDAKFTEVDRTLFAFASYNCGPGNVSKMRKEAVKRGLDPDKWFNNVELVVAEKIGMETTTYVRNIYKYYASYKLVQGAQAAAAKAREGVERKR